MAKVYMYRHQKAGIVTSHVFASPPTEEQMAPIKAEVERLHGREGWGQIFEAEFVASTDEIPSFPPRDAGGATENKAAAAELAISGTGTVTNPA